MLNEGQHNKAALKMVFLAGTPGSGKNYIAEKLFGIQKGKSFSAYGLKLVSFDSIFENMLKSQNIDPATLNALPKEEADKVTNFDNPNSLVSKARIILKKQLKHHMKNGDGIIFDGTGQFTGAYFEKKDLAENLGYDTYMIYVESPLEKALERNAKRSRRLPDDIVSKIHRSVKYNKKAYENDFGDDMVVVDNSSDNGAIPPEAVQLAHRIVTAPVQNVKGRYFLKKGTRPWLAKKPNLPKDIKPGSEKKPGTALAPFKGHSSPAPHSDVVYGPAKYKPKAPDPNQFDWTKRFKDKQDAKKKEPSPQPEPTGYNDDSPPVSTKPPTDSLEGKRIRNNQTGNDILVTTALKYPPGHPMRRAAELERKKLRPKDY